MDSETGGDVAEITERASLFEAQNAILEKSARGANLHSILKALCLQVESLLDGHPRCSVLLHVDGTLQHGAAPTLSKSYVDAIDGTPVGPRSGSCGTAIFRGEMVVSDDIQRDPLWENHKEFAAAENLNSCWSTPVFAPDDDIVAAFAILQGKRQARRQTTN